MSIICPSWQVFYEFVYFPVVTRAVVQYKLLCTMVPTGTGKPGKNGKAFSSQGKVREFCQDWKSQGKIREFCSKYWENEKKLSGILKKNTGRVREIWQPVIVKTLQIWYHTLNKKRTLKKYWKTAKNTGKVREILSPKKWEA